MRKSEEFAMFHDAPKAKKSHQLTKEIKYTASEKIINIVSALMESDGWLRAGDYSEKVQAHFGPDLNRVMELANHMQHSIEMLSQSCKALVQHMNILNATPADSINLLINGKLMNDIRQAIAKTECCYTKGGCQPDASCKI